MEMTFEFIQTISCLDSSSGTRDEYNAARTDADKKTAILILLTDDYSEYFRMAGEILFDS